jgi:hypothetical protein
MILQRKKPLAIFLLSLFTLALIGCSKSSARAAKARQASEQSRAGMEQAMQVFDQYVESVRWSRYWFRNTQENDAYVEGKQIFALIFWTKTSSRPKRGLCSPDLSLCIANGSSSDWRGFAKASVDPSLAPQLAFESFARRNYGDGDAWFPPLNPDDFEFTEKSITLPSLGLPSAILHRIAPEEGRREANRLWQDSKKNLCWDIGTQRPLGCTGTVVYAYYNEADPSWYTLRTCSPACQPEFRGDSIQALSRREWGWTATAGGFTNTPADIEWFKPRILKAEMFRFELQ